MSRLKALRESRKLTQTQLAKEIGFTIKEITDWEIDYNKIPKLGLSSLAYIFGLSSENLLDFFEEKVSRTTTNRYCLTCNKDIEDGWWGHLGIRLYGQKEAKWFPITLQTANNISTKLSNLNLQDEWIIVETLNNRILVFRPATVNQMWLLDEASDQIGNEWEEPWDGYSGNPGEFYRFLEEMYAWEDAICDDKEIPSLLKQEVETFTDVLDLGHEEIRNLTIETQIYNTDGTEFSELINERKLADIINNFDYEVQNLIFDLSNDDYELYIPSSKISLIDIPKRRVDEAYRDIIKELEE